MVHHLMVCYIGAPFCVLDLCVLEGMREKEEMDDFKYEEESRENRPVERLAPSALLLLRSY